MNDDNFDMPIIWIDLEMTGLNDKKDQIIEIAVIVTDGQLSKQKEGPSLEIYCSDELLNGMDEWCSTHHGQSGLTQKCRQSKITLEEAEKQVLEFLEKDCKLKKGEAVLGGNSIYNDKIFLSKDMPNLNNFIHYRLIDVSSLKCLCQRWYPSIYANAPPKKESHRALDDIKESIAELEYYRKTIMIPKN
jgi:oligoribonuclease